MKRTALALMLIALVASCNTEPKTAVQKKVDSYALVKIESPDLSGITDNGKEVLNLYKFAADQADSIYWMQCFGDKKLIENLKDPDLRDYALINYGPWDRLDGKAFVEGFGENLRLDAVVAAMKIVRLVDEMARELNDGTVTTCGSIHVEPGAPNVVPGRVEMSVECRSPHQASIDTIFGAVERLLTQLQTSGYQTETIGLMEVAPVHLSEKVIAALSQGLRENGLPLKMLPSGAGHDSMFISRVTDVGMLFVPSKDGRSHCPEEFTDAADIARCCDVIYSALKELDCCQK